MAKIGKKNAKKQNRYRVNDQIRIREVRVVGPDGSQIGVLPIQDAKDKAKEYGLDLVEIAPQARPPVCRIVDFGKMRYDQTKKEKQLKKNSSQQSSKTIKMKPNIGDNDLQRKISDIQKFLEKGHRVVVIIRFKGREKKFVQNVQEDLLGKVQEGLEFAVMDKPSMQGSQVTATFTYKPE
jgi:translation initiation factor IF-3